MKYDINILKGIRPGVVIERDLMQKQITQARFAQLIGEYPSRISEIINGRRALTVPMALKIEQALEYEQGFLMTLQVHYDIKMELQKQSRQQGTPDMSKLSPSLFWDTDINKIDWQFHKRAVIERVFAYGNDEEKAEITRFYGQAEIEKYAKAPNGYRIAYLTQDHDKARI